MTDEELAKKIGQELATLRLRKLESLFDVSVAVGISKSYLSEIENGNKMPSLSYLNTLLNYYGTTFAKLFHKI